MIDALFLRVHVIHLSLYNLMLSEGGRDGFFRWNTGVCKFIEVRELTLCNIETEDPVTLVTGIQYPFY